MKQNWFDHVKAKLPIYNKTFTFCDKKRKAAQSKYILTSTIEFLKATERFKTPLSDKVPNEMVLLTHCHF